MLIVDEEGDQQRTYDELEEELAGDPRKAFAFGWKYALIWDRAVRKAMDTPLSELPTDPADKDRA